MGGLSAETVGALLPSPPLHRWVRVARVVVCGCCVGLLAGYLEGEISGFFFFFFQLVASFLVELEATVMVVVVWLCRDGGGGFCCGLVILFGVG